MPTYEYECRSCEHRFELFQSIMDDAITDCPECGKTVRRLIGAGAGIIFKGSGFYVTDSRSSSSNGKKNAKTDRSDAGSSSSDSSASDGKGKSEAKSGDSNGSSATGSGDSKTKSGTNTSS